MNTADTDSTQIVVYSHERCSACRVVKEFLSRQGVQFTVKNVATDAAARDEFLRAGFFLPPVTVIAGVAVAGYQPDRIQELLEEYDSGGAL